MASLTTAILSMLAATMIAGSLSDERVNKKAETGYVIFSKKIAALHDSSFHYLLFSTAICKL